MTAPTTAAPAATTAAGPRQAPHHDTLTCYTDYRCRRPECVDRYNAYNRDCRRQIAAGTWEPLLDAEPVRQHLLALHAAGITIHRVAKLTGIPFRNVRSFTQHDYGNRAGRRHRVTREVAEKLLAITVETHTPAYVDPTGSRRRVEALAAIGWPSIHVARAAGIHPSNRTTTFDSPTIMASTARKFAAAYDQLKGQKPEQQGIRKSSITTVRLRAKNLRWPPPSYWDETGAIDDPDFVPDYGKSRLEIVAEDARWLMASGLDRAEAARRLGKDKSYIDRALAAYPEAVAS